MTTAMTVKFCHYTAAKANAKAAAAAARAAKEAYVATPSPASWADWAAAKANAKAAKDDEAWERGFAALERYKAREGHVRVPIRHEESIDAS